MEFSGLGIFPIAHWTPRRGSYDENCIVSLLSARLDLVVTVSNLPRMAQSVEQGLQLKTALSGSNGFILLSDTSACHVHRGLAPLSL